MSIESLVALKDRYKDNSRPNFGTEVLNILVDEIVALDGRVEEKGAEIDALDAKVDALEGEIATLKEQMANRMLCKKYDTEE